MKREWSVLCLLVLLSAATGCGKKSENGERTEGTAPKAGSGLPVSPVLRNYPLDGLEGVITQTRVAFDKKTSTDGGGSLMLLADAPTTFRLFETGDVDIENARIVYRAKLRTEGVEGKVYLEMWCSFPGVGEAFSRALHAPLSGTMDWTSQETPFFLKPGENPDNIKLNLVVEGKGRVWIDDIRLLRGPLDDI